MNILSQPLACCQQKNRLEFRRAAKKAKIDAGFQECLKGA